MTSTFPSLSSSSSSSSLIPSSSPTNMNIINSSDGEIFIIDDDVADQMPAIRTSLEFLSDITGVILSKVIEYCKTHVQNPNNIQELKNWDQQFVNEIDLNTLFQLILAAKSLEIHSLYDLTCQTMADMMKGRSMEEIRRNFNIKNHDFRSKNDEQIIRDFNHWRRLEGSRSSSRFSSSYPLCMFFCMPFSTLFERFKTIMVSCFSSFSSKKMVILSSSEGKIFKVEEKVALQSEMIKNLLEESDYRVILLEVNTVILSNVLEYCQKHVINDDDDDDHEELINYEELINWDAEFVMVDQKTLFDVINAANYLQIKSLLNFTCHFLAYMILEQ